MRVNSGPSGVAGMGAPDESQFPIARGIVTIAAADVVPTLPFEDLHHKLQLDLIQLLKRRLQIRTIVIGSLA